MQEQGDVQLYPTAAMDTGMDSGVEQDYDQENDAHHVIQPQTDTDTASSDFDEGYVCF